MKKHTIYLYILSFLVFLFLTKQSRSQSLNYTGLYSEMNTNYLADRSGFSERLSNFSPSQFPDTGTHENFFDAILTLNNMNMGHEQSLDLDKIRQKIQEYRNSGIVPLTILDYTYERIPEEFLNEDILGFDTSTDSIFFKSSLPRPLGRDTMTMAYTTIDMTSLELTFSIPPDLYFSNNSKMTQFEIDFADGKGFRPVTLGQQVNIRYPDFEGDFAFKTIEIRFVQRTDVKKGTPVSFVRTLHKAELLPDVRKMSNELPAITCLPDGSPFAQASVEIRYGKENTVNDELRHPVVFIEGFDADTDPTDDRFGSVSWHTIMTGLSFDESGNRARGNLADIKYLSALLFENNYDLVFINFRDATDDIFANGNTVIKILKWLESQKVGSDGISVIGASMGGVLARYAIRQMEVTDCGHCVKLYATFDSPHRGANVAVGLQYAVDFLKEVSSSAQFGSRGLARKGAMQLLQYNITPGASSYRTTWDNWLKTNGHPQLCKRIAISNASPIGKNASFQPGDIYYKFSHSYAGTLMSEIELSALKDCRNKSSCDGKVFKGLLPQGSNGIQKFLNMYFGKSYLRTVRYAANTLPLDNITGSYSNWVLILHSAINEFLSSDAPPGKSTFSYLNEDEPTFVPASSSFDMDYSILSPNFQKLFPGKLTSSLHPFDAIYYHDNQGLKNELHATPQIGVGRNISWLLEQLETVEIDHPHSVPAGTGLNAYNMQGRPHTRLISKLTIGQGGRFTLNERARDGFDFGTDISGQDHLLNSQYSAKGCDAMIIIENDGVLQLGEEQYDYPMSLRSDLTIGHGAILEIKSGGKLHINDGSSVTLGPDSKLILHPGSEIILDGTHSQLVLQGLLDLRNGGIFSVKGGTANGLVVLDGNSLSIKGKSGSGSGISIQGNENSGDVRLRVKSKILIPSEVDRFVLDRCSIQCMEDSELRIESKSDISNSIFNGTTKSSKGLNFNTSGEVNLKSCRLENLTTAVSGDRTPSSFKMENCIFKENKFGIQFPWKTLSISNNAFIANEIGLECSNVESLLISSSKFVENKIALYSMSKELDANVKLFKCDLSRNETGILSKGAELVLGCNVFEENDIAVDLLTGSRLSMSNGQHGSFDEGTNTFANNSKSIKLDKSDLYMKSGANNFIRENSTGPHRFISGSISSNCDCLDQNLDVNGEGNYWFPDVPSGGLQYASNHYSLFVPTTPHHSVVKLRGSARTQADLSCTNYSFEQNDNNEGKRFEPEGEPFLTLSPNPSVGLLQLTYSNHWEGMCRIRITNTLGQLIYNHTIELSQQRAQLDLSSILTSGCYVIELVSDQQFHRQNLIIRK